VDMEQLSAYGQLFRTAGRAVAFPDNVVGSRWTWRQGWLWAGWRQIGQCRHWPDPNTSMSPAAQETHSTAERQP